jgi:hypothetical protein
MAQIDLHYVDELIAVRQKQHGGGPGAPLILGGHRVGASINRSCVVMLSALLQSYVEEVFQDAAKRAFPALAADQPAFDQYWKQMKSWGNPSDQNIKNLFIKLGIPDVFVGLSWQRTPTTSVRWMLDALNQIRNQIAHGSRRLTLGGNRFSMSLAAVTAYRNMTASFANRFEAHVRTFIP